MAARPSSLRLPPAEPSLSLGPGVSLGSVQTGEDRVATTSWVTWSHMGSECGPCSPGTQGLPMPPLRRHPKLFFQLPWQSPTPWTFLVPVPKLVPAGHPPPLLPGPLHSQAHGLQDARTDVKLPAGTHPALPCRVQPAGGQSVSPNRSFGTAAAHGLQGQGDLDVPYPSSDISQQDRRVEMSPLDRSVVYRVVEPQ